MKFVFPRLWRGTFWEKSIVVLNFALIFIAKAANSINPIMLKYAVDSIVCDRTIPGNSCPSEEETYLLIGAFTGFKYIYNLLENFREIPYAKMSATAEITIAHDVYDHVQRLSLAYHLSRETGKITRIVSRGSSSFTSILRMFVFNIVPIAVEISIVLVIFVSMFSWEFCALQLASIATYVVFTYYMTERRAKGFKDLQEADKNYNQKATDSLLNFETVKYFIAEKHEEDRFKDAMAKYKAQSVNVAKSLVLLNLSQTLVIKIGLCLTLSLALYFLQSDKLTVGGFVMFNAYNMQLY